MAEPPQDAEPTRSGNKEPAAPRLRLVFDDLDFSIEGWSVAGVETWLVVPEWSLALDCGRVAAPSVRCRHLALTHAHLDHAGNLAGWLGLRSMYALGHADVYAPSVVCGDLERVVAIWARLQGITPNWTLHPAAPGDRFGLGGNRELVALAADHSVPALGWAVTERRHHLLPSLHGLAGPMIAARKAQGETITTSTELPLLAISGDTRASVAAVTPALQDAAVVMHEVTLLSDAHPPQRAHDGGHTHLADLVDSPVAANARYFVPYHISQRYGAAEARRLLDAAFKPRFGARLRPFLPEGA
jgi:ribonuclease Z